MRRHVRPAVVALALAAVSPMAVAAQDAAPATAEEIIEKLGFDQSALAKVKAGEILTIELTEGNERELGLAVVMLIKGSLPAVIEAMKSGKTLQVSGNVLAFKTIPNGDADEAAFADVAFDAGESAEIAKLLEVKPGSTFNLSSAEIAALQAAARPYAGQAVTPQARAAMNAAYRAVLLGRYRAYQDGGLSAVAPYDRGSGAAVRPGEDLLHALPLFWILPQKLPEFYRALQNYPKDQPPRVENQMLWIKQMAQNRPTFVLAHRTYYTAPSWAAIAEQQYFVGQSFNALMIVGGVSATPEGALVFYGNRTETDQVSGFGSTAKHAIGRGIMKDEILREFRAIRSKVGG